MELHDSKGLGLTSPSQKPIFVVEPTSTHSYSIILLHGLSSKGESFGTELLETGVTSTGKKLPQLLPGARWIFPTAKRRRSTTFGRAMLTQWFDVVRLPDPEYRRETQLQGLSESVLEIRELIHQEMSKVPPEHIIIGGLSQGCAMSLSVLLSLEHRLGGFIGMSGYLPFKSDIEYAVETTEMDGDDPFATGDGDSNDEPADPEVKAMVFERDLLCLDPLPHPTRETTASRTPVFLGHGNMDEKKPVKQGEAAARAMRAAGYKVQWKSYADLGHWYKIPDEIDDIVNFIQCEIGWLCENDK
ncbi:acyl-protein thioesterase [Hypoxylon rubiginosum]|uniref:Acyl-protein thioesterase n=1 Tax=Hypoxylon rubiginosum TaxID=110542 RepID=A0ACC0DNL8_9PEZI|nr:acyl-protein thioesterase [Hypoxylon rubiginosum]